MSLQISSHKINSGLLNKANFLSFSFIIPILIRFSNKFLNFFRCCKVLDEQLQVIRFDCKNKPDDLLSLKIVLNLAFLQFF